MTLWLVGWLPVGAWLWPEGTWIRLDLASHGWVFVRVVEKGRLDVFKYTHTDNFRLRSLVFSGDRLVGYSIWPSGSGPYFVPAQERITFEEPGLYALDWRQLCALLYWWMSSIGLMQLIGMVNIVVLPTLLVRVAIRHRRAQRGTDCPTIGTPVAQ